MTVLSDALAGEVPGLFRYALALTRDPDRAQDLVQDVVVTALERAATFRGESSPATWLHRIMYHRFVDDLRARHDEPLDPEALATAVEHRWQLDSYTVDAETVVLRAETAEDLRDALSHLPADYRSAVILHDIEEWTAVRIADVHQISLPAAKQRIRRGRMMLVTALAEAPRHRLNQTGVPMRCWSARAKVSDYLDGELSAPERVSLERHLQGCPTCPPLYAGIVGVHEALGRLRDPDTVVPAGLAERLRGLAATDG